MNADSVDRPRASSIHGVRGTPKPSSCNQNTSCGKLLRSRAVKFGVWHNSLATEVQFGC